MVMNKTFYKVLMFLFLILWFITILFALTVLIIIIRHWRTKCRSIVNLLTCNSCAALLFFVTTAIIQIPSYIQGVYFDTPQPSPFVCKIYAGLATFGTTVLVYSFLVQAISRFFITILFKYKFLLTFRTNWIMIIISWITSGIIAGGFYISPLAYQYDPESYACTLTAKHFPTALTANIIMTTVTITTMIILYGIILYGTVRHTHIIPNNTSRLRAIRNKVVSQRIVIFLSIFATGGTPYFVCTLLARISQAPYLLYPITLLSISIACAINSIAILLTNDQVKEILLTKLTGRQANQLNNIRITKRNQIVPHSTK